MLPFLLIHAALCLTPDDANVILQIEAQRLPPAALESFVRSPDADTRARAARALGRLRVMEARPGLEDLSVDPDPRVRAEAAWALGQTPDTSALILKMLASERNVAARAALLEALGFQGGADGIPVLLAALETRPPAFRGAPEAEAAAVALGRLAMREVPGVSDPAVTGALLGALSWLDTDSRRGAAFAVGRISASAYPDDQTVTLLRAVVEDRDPVVRAFLVRATGKMTLSPEVRDALYSRTAADPDQGVRVATARAAAVAGWPGVTRLLDDAEVGVRMEAISAIGRVPDLDHPALLLPILERGASLDASEAARTHGDPSELLAAAALSALASAGALPETGPASLDVLLMPAQPTRLRAAAAAALPDRDRLVELAVKDGESSVRLEAASRLLELGPDLAQLIRLFDAFDDQVVAMAADHAASHPSAALERPILDALTAAEPDEIDLLSYGLKALIALYNGAKPVVPKPAPEVVTLAESLIGHAEIGISNAAMEIARIGGQRPTPNVHRVISVPLDEVARVASARVRTTRGEFIVTLLPDEAPVTVWNFASLADKGYYNGLVVHRVVPDFVVQDGDPRGDGAGGPGYTIPDELWPGHYREGAVGMALSGPDTGGSQWFVTLSPQPHLDGGYTIFGEVSQGMGTLRAMQPGDRVLSVTIERLP